MILLSEDECGTEDWKAVSYGNAEFAQTEWELSGCKECLGNWVVTWELYSKAVHFFGSWPKTFLAVHEMEKLYVCICVSFFILVFWVGNIWHDV